jgi:NADH-quinone oxidoreductase subunit L
MLSLLWLIPILPLLSFLILAVAGRYFSRQVSAIVGTVSVGLSALISILVAASFLSNPPAGTSFEQTLWTWIQVSNFNIGISFRLDALSLIMILVVTFVAFFIHFYSAEYMEESEGYSRFFAYMNLFVGSMLLLVLADNLLLLYLGWEGVGLCSYLLIGFWYQDKENGYAARKAFVVTRVGDTAFAIGLFLLFTNLGTLNIQDILSRASQLWASGSTLPIIVTLLLLGGAVGKSAQLPLQTWLPDAMAGPTPVSALIHAATMVTAGVYLIARMHTLYSLAPAVMLVVAIIGAATLLLAGFSALTQSDIKRVLAYSTISQIGYMFLALGVGAWSAAILHFMVHAFFKALLFLAAGAIILGLHEEHNMFKMGGLRHQAPLTFWTFLIGSLSLSALPLVTAGFYSKDLILYQAYASNSGNLWLWIAGLVGALLTSIYTFRMVFLTFFGTEKSQMEHKPGLRIEIPLVVLAFLSVVGGLVELPPILGNHPFFSNFLASVLPNPPDPHGGTGIELVLEAVAAIVSLGGIYLAYIFFIQRRQLTGRVTQTAFGNALHRFWFSGWGFDRVYDFLFVRPVVWMAQVNKDDIIDAFFEGVGSVAILIHGGLSLTQTGKLRHYAVGILIGAVIITGLVVLL